MKLLSLVGLSVSFVAGLVASAAAQEAGDPVPLGVPVSVAVEAGRPGVAGVLIPGGATGIAFSAKLVKGSGLDPSFAIRRPDGTLLDEAALRAAGVSLTVSPKGIKGKGLTAATSGMYEFIVRGRNGTSGGFTLVVKGKPARPPAVTGNFTDTGQIHEIPIRVSSGTLLSLALKGTAGATFFPDVSLVTSTGFPLDLTGFATTAANTFTLRAFPLPWFGDYTIRIRSLGGTGGYGLKLKTAVMKSAPPGRPVADAGADIVVEPGSIAVLSGNGGTGVSLRWEQVSGPPVTLSDPVAASPAFLAPAATGPRVFSLVAFEGGLPSAESFAVVRVDHLPVAVAGASQRVIPGAAVLLDGSGSFDLDAGDLLGFEWSQVSGDPVVLSGPRDAAPSFTAPSADQVLAFELRVHDGVAGSRADRVVVGVGAAWAVADAGRPTLVPPDDTVHLSAARSIPAVSGAPGTFAWTAVDIGSGTPALENPDTPTPSFLVPRSAGRYLFRVHVDGDASSYDEVLVLVTHSVHDRVPRASAGGRQSVAVAAPFLLTSADPPGRLRAHEWRQIGGADAALAGSGATRDGTAPPTPDVLQFLLMVHDGWRYGPPDRATVTAGAAPTPVADAGPDRSGAPGQLITLSGSGLAGPGRSIAGYAWRQTSGLDFHDVAAEDPGFDPYAASASFFVPATLSSLNPTRALTFALTVTDDLGTPSLEDVMVVDFTNLPPNAGPVVLAGASSALVRPGTPVSLIGIASDGDGDLLTILWSLVSGPAAVTIQNATRLDASFTAPLIPGAYQFRLEADDGTGTANAVGEAFVTITVNSAPDLTLVFAVPSSGPQGTPVALSAAGVFDPDGDVLSFAWMEPNPPGGSPVSLTGAGTNTATFTMPAYSGTVAARTRTFRVTVTDALGAVTKDVSFVPNAAPFLGLVQASAAKIRYDGTTAALLSAPLATDADGDPVTLAWSVLTGPTVSQSLLSAATGSSVSFRVPLPSPSSPSRGGIYTIQAVASDGALASLPGTVQVMAYPSWAGDVYPIINANCASCHGTSGGLNMSTAALAYSNLRNVAAIGTTALRVKPNDAANSYLHFRVNTGQMPAGGPKLAQHLINIIRDWIEPDGILGLSALSGGAENN